MEDYRKINKWIEIHWKTISIIVSFTIALIIPVIVYKSAIRFAFDKNISANNIFTGLIAYCGIIISFLGIYWKTTREEENKRKGICSVFLYSFEENNKYKNKDFFTKFMSSRYSFFSEEQDYFSNVDTEFINKNLESILLQDYGKDFIKYYTKVETLNKKVKNMNASITDKIMLEINNVESEKIESLEKKVLIFIHSELRNISDILFNPNIEDISFTEKYYNENLMESFGNITYNKKFICEDGKKMKNEIYDFKLEAIQHFILNCLEKLRVKNIYETLLKIHNTIGEERILIPTITFESMEILKLGEKYIK